MPRNAKNQHETRPKGDYNNVTIQWHWGKVRWGQYPLRKTMGKAQMHNTASTPFRHVLPAEMNGVDFIWISWNFFASEWEILNK